VEPEVGAQVDDVRGGGFLVDRGSGLQPQRQPHHDGRGERSLLRGGGLAERCRQDGTRSLEFRLVLRRHTVDRYLLLLAHSGRHPPSGACDGQPRINHWPGPVPPDPDQLDQPAATPSSTRYRPTGSTTGQAQFHQIQTNWINRRPRPVPPDPDQLYQPPASPSSTRSRPTASTSGQAQFHHIQTNWINQQLRPVPPDTDQVDQPGARPSSTGSRPIASTSGHAQFHQIQTNWINRRPGPLPPDADQLDQPATRPSSTRSRRTGSTSNHAQFHQIQTKWINKGPGPVPPDPTGSTSSTRSRPT